MQFDFPIIVSHLIVRSIEKAMRRYYFLRSPILAWLWGVKHRGQVAFLGRTIVRSHRRGEISLGSKVVFNAYYATNLVGLTGSTILDVYNGGHIYVGDNSGFSSVVISSRSEVQIGSRVMIGGNVRIFDHDFHALDPKIRCSVDDRFHVRTRPVIIEDDVFVGTNSIILKGSRIGARSIVAAGSVVFGLQIPPDSLVKGNPAMIVKRRESGVPR